jgi:hypothetical protein
MAVDDFLLIVAEGWTELPNADHIIAINGGFTDVDGDIAGQDWNQMNEYDGLKETEYLPLGWHITDARILNAGGMAGTYRLWIKTAPD